MTEAAQEHDISPHAYKAARFEIDGAKNIWSSALEMVKMAEEGLSTTAIAEQVTAVGFSISQATVSNRIQSVVGKRKPGPQTESLSVTDKLPTEEQFEENYKAVNNPPKLVVVPAPAAEDEVSDDQIPELVLFSLQQALSMTRQAVAINARLAKPFVGDLIPSLENLKKLIQADIDSIIPTTKESN